MKKLKFLFLIILTLTLSSVTASAQQHKLEDILTKLNSEQVANRIWAADELAWGARTKTAEVFDALLNTLQDDHHQVRFAAISALERFGDLRAVEPLRKVYKSDPVIRLRNKARKAIYKLNKEKLPVLKDTQKLVVKPVKPVQKVNSQAHQLFKEISNFHYQVFLIVVGVSILVIMIPGAVVGLISAYIVKRIRHKVFGWFNNVIWGVVSLFVAQYPVALLASPVLILKAPYIIWASFPIYLIIAFVINILMLLLMSYLRPEKSIEGKA